MRKILVVVDMQNDFIDGALGTPEAVAIVENVKARIREYDQADIFVTMDTHAPNYLETQEGRNLPVEHCIKGTEGWRIRKDIAKLLPDWHVYEKPTFGSVALSQKTLRRSPRMRRSRSKCSDSARISAWCRTLSC